MEGEVVSHELVEEEGCFGHGEGFGGAGATGEGVAWEGGDDEVVGEGFWGVFLLEDG